MLKDCNVWSFLVVSSICGCAAYIFHESMEYDKYPVMEYDHTTEKIRFYVTDNQTKELEGK